MELESARITFRRFTEADFPTYFSLVADPEIMRFITGKPLDEAQARARFAISIRASEAHPVFGGYLLYARGTDTCIGNFKFVPDHDDPANATEIGYMLKAAYRGQGLAVEASQRMIALARTLPALKRLTAIADPHNIASTTVLGRCGFTCLRVYEENGLLAASFELIL
jgi:ribosomal-protein-alanine N-acetyltransferase